MSLLNNDLKVFVTLYAHYPEAHNSTVINNKLNLFFEKNNSSIISYVDVCSIPHCEEENIVINVSLKEFNNEFNNIFNEFKDYIFNYFNGNIKTIIIEYRK